MNWKIFYSQRAFEELDSIVDYISNVLLEPEIAEKLFNLIISEINGLNQMPMRYKLLDDEPWRVRESEL